MKKAIYISGIILANLLLIGCIFKLNHWPGAGVALTLSLVGISFWFLPLALIHHYKNQKNQKNKWLYIATFLTFFITFIAALFKIQHWPGASMLLLVGIPIPFILFLPVYLYHSIKDKDQPTTNFTAIILGLIFIAIYSGLLNVNISKVVLDHGLFLTKSNENVIDFYQEQITNLQKANPSNKQINKVIEKSDAICSLIYRAKKDLLNTTENEHLDPDFGKTTFNASNINKYDSRNSTQYILIWQDGAVLPQLTKEINSLKNYLSSLQLDPELKALIADICKLEDVVIDGEKYTWIEREFTTDFMIFGFEALSRCEKNIRFIETAVIEDLAGNSKLESANIAEFFNKNK